MNKKRGKQSKNKKKSAPLSFLDVVGYNFNLNLDKKGKSHKTTFGGIASLVVVGLLSAYFVTLFLKLLDHNPQQL